MKAHLYSKQGDKKKELVLNAEIFSARVNKRLLELAHKAFAANLRSGTASTKTRKEVRGGGKKPWKQKGTGRARAGSTRSPVWKGGGVVFGPHPRDYTVKMSQEMRKQALISALSLRGQEKNIFVLEDTKLDTPKTKEWVEIMKALPLEGKRALCVVNAFTPNLKRASQNFSNRVDVQSVSDVNAYHVLQRERLLIDQEALSQIEKRLLGTGEATAPKVKAESPKKKVTTKRKKVK